MDPVDVGELRRVEDEVARAGVVVSEVEVVVEDEALRDHEVVRLVGRRGRDGAVVRQHDERDREEGQADEERDTTVTQPAERGPQPSQRVQRERAREADIDDAELAVRDRLAEAREQQRRRDREQEAAGSCGPAFRRDHALERRRRGRDAHRS